MNLIVDFAKSRWSPVRGFKTSLASSVCYLTSRCNERTWNAEGTDTIMTSPEREASKISTKRSAAGFDRRQELHGRPTRLLLYSKMLLVPISFFLCGVDYSLEGSTFSLSKCDFSLLFHTGRSWHVSIYCDFCVCSVGFALWWDSISFVLFWSIKLFIVAE